MFFMLRKIGFDHIGIGSDFDGMVDSVNGLEDVSKYPELVATMLLQGHPQRVMWKGYWA
jgi:membrane dipeptidase